MQNRSKWDNVWIMCCTHDATCIGSALAYQRWYDVPSDKFYVYTTSPQAHILLQNQAYTTITTDSKKTILDNATEADKLLVISHGNADTIFMEGGLRFTGSQFGEFLYEKGLRRIGLITINACRFGLSNGPTNLLQGFQDRSGQAGAVKGYKMDVVTYLPTGKTNHVDEPREVTLKEGWTENIENLPTSQLAMGLGQSGNDSWRYLIAYGSLFKNSVATKRALEHREANEPHKFQNQRQQRLDRANEIAKQPLTAKKQQLLNTQI